MVLYDVIFIAPIYNERYSCLMFLLKENNVAVVVHCGRIN